MGGVSRGQQDMRGRSGAEDTVGEALAHGGRAVSIVSMRTRSSHARPRRSSRPPRTRDAAPRRLNRGAGGFAGNLGGRYSPTARPPRRAYCTASARSASRLAHLARGHRYAVAHRPLLRRGRHIPIPAGAANSWACPHIASRAWHRGAGGPGVRRAAPHRHRSRRRGERFPRVCA